MKTQASILAGGPDPRGRSKLQFRTGHGRCPLANHLNQNAWKSWPLISIPPIINKLFKLTVSKKMPAFKGFKHAIAIILCLFSTTSLAADLIDILQQAAEQDPQIRAANAAMLAQMELVPQSRAQLLPTLTVSGNTTKFDRELSGDTATVTEDFNAHGYSARLVQPLIRLDRWYQLQAAKSNSNQALVEYEDAKQDLLIRVAQAYFSILRTDDNLSSALAQEKAFNRQLEQTQERFEVGVIAITGVHESQAAYDLARVERITREEERDNSFTALESLTKRVYTTIAPLNKLMPITPPEPAQLQIWVDLALANNLSLQIARHQTEASRQQVKLSRAGHLPTLDAVANYSYNEQGGLTFLGNESDIRSYALELNLPLFTGGGTRSKVREANYRLTQSKENYENTYRQVRQNIQTQHRSVTTDILRIGARKLALKSSQSALEATEGGYEVGTRNVVDVLQVKDILFQSQRDYHNAIYDYIINSLQLKRIAGTLEEGDLAKLNQWLRQVARKTTDFTETP